MSHWGRLIRDRIGPVSPHEKIHSGQFYGITAISQGVADNGTLEVVLTTNPTRPQTAISFTPSAGGDALFNFYEAPTSVVGGSALSVLNHDRVSSNEYDGSAIQDPSSIGGDGTLLTAETMAGGSGPHTGGSSSNNLGEWLLKNNTAYLFRITNVAGSAKTLSLILNLYKEG